MTEKIGVVIQARMGSSRLPEKSLRMVGGLPMLERIRRRAASVESVDKVVVATTTSTEDDEIEAYCRRKDIDFYRGKEWDLLSRIREAAERFRLDAAVRVWGDCPCIPPSVIEKSISALRGRDLDYVSNFHAGKSFPKGTELEAYRKEVLDRVYGLTDDEFYRQYPYEYITENEEEFEVGYLKNKKKLSDISVTVDYPEDLKLVRKMYDYFAQNELFGLTEIVDFHDNHPELSDLASEMPRNIEYVEEKSEHERSG